MISRIIKKKNLTSFLILIGILIIGAFFRFYNLNWDQNQHLHPDERFLTMVGNAMSIPKNPIDYFNPQTSSFNPENIGFKFFVYGILPVSLNKIIAVGLGNDNYNAFTIQGRVLSAFVDFLIIILIFKTISLFEKHYKLHPSIKYLGAFLYAITVLPIQLSHFFAVDTFLSFFMFASFYFALRYSYKKNYFFLAVSGLFFGFAVSSKISAIFILPLILFFLLKGFLNTGNHHSKKMKIFGLFALLVFFFLISYFSGRLSDPYLYSTGNFLDLRINTLFLENIKALQNMSTPAGWFPPAVQWINKTPILFPLINIAFFGVGVVYFLHLFVGAYCLIIKRKHFDLLVILFWMLLFFLYQSIQFSTTMRYFLPLYPFLAIIAAIGFYELKKLLPKRAIWILLFSVVVWPVFFLSIYTKDHSRIQASKWIYDNVPNGSLLLNEHWDDSLPIGAPTYAIEQLPVFDPDNPGKWQKINTMLALGNYLILSSNRGWGSIPTVPERYPQMTKFYQDLFSGKAQYKKVAEFTSYPSLAYLGIPITISDDWSEEAFTVYDHPKVIIFKKQ